MPRKRDGFVPIGDVADGLSLPGGRALIPHAATPQARHHFTTLRQVNQLIEASEADADLFQGFCAALRRPTGATAGPGHRPTPPDMPDSTDSDDGGRSPGNAGSR